MNGWESFVVKQIINGQIYPKEIIDPVIDLYLTRYRQNQFDSATKLIFEARQELERRVLARKKLTNNNLREV